MSKGLQQLGAEFKSLSNLLNLSCTGMDLEPVEADKLWERYFECQSEIIRNLEESNDATVAADR